MCECSSCVRNVRNPSTSACANPDEGVLEEGQVAFFSDEIDRIRTVPGWEPKHDAELPVGHYPWRDHATDLDPGGFMDRRDLLPYHQAFIDLVDASPVFDYIVDIMGRTSCSA